MVGIKVNAESFANLIKLVSVVRDEIVFKIDEKLTVSARDYINSSMIYAELDAAEVSGKGVIPMKIDLLKAVLSKLGTDGHVDITLNDKIYIKACNTVYEGTPVKDAGVTKKPELSFDVSCVVETLDLKRAVNLASYLNDYVTFSYDKDLRHLKLIAEGGDCKLEVTLSETENKNEAKARYNAVNLRKFVKEIPAEKVELKFSTDYPLCLSFENGDLYVEYFLAPVVV